MTKRNHLTGPTILRAPERMTYDEFMLFVGTHPATTGLARRIRSTARSG